jgi:hypothetical protein
MWDRQNAPIVRQNFQSADATGTITNYAYVNQGVYASARLIMSAAPANNDTITIGGHVFKFLTTLVAANTYTQVKIGTAAATCADLVKAINGTSSTNVVQATTQFAKAVLADAVASTTLRLRWATARGGSALAGVADSIALAESITDAADIWNCANLNVAGKAPADYQCAEASFTVTAQMVTNGSYQLELPFTPTIFSVYVTSSTGVLRSSNEAIVISGNALSFTMAGGASPNLQAGDIVNVFAGA